MRTSVIVLMSDGQQQYTTWEGVSLRNIGRAFKSAIESGPVQEAVIVTSLGIARYTANEVTELVHSGRLDG